MEKSFNYNSSFLERHKYSRFQNLQSYYVTLLSLHQFLRLYFQKTGASARPSP